MIQKIVISFVISFVIRQLEKFKESIDWKKVKVDLDERVRKIVPGTWFDDEVIMIVGAAFDTIKGVLDKSGQIKHLLELLAAQKYDEAISVLKEIMLGRLVSGVSLSAAECKLKSCLLT